MVLWTALPSFQLGPVAKLGAHAGLELPRWRWLDYGWRRHVRGNLRPDRPMCEEWTAPNLCGRHPERAVVRAIDRSLQYQNSSFRPS